jgi:hypothetical protein
MLLHTTSRQWQLKLAMRVCIQHASTAAGEQNLTGQHTVTVMAAAMLTTYVHDKTPTPQSSLETCCLHLCNTAADQPGCHFITLHAPLHKPMHQLQLLIVAACMLTANGHVLHKMPAAAFHHKQCLYHA